MTTTRTAAKVRERHRNSLEQISDKGISSNLLQKLFEEFGEKMTATVKKEMEESFIEIKKKDLKELGKLKNL